jgi:hypothetical protein
MHGMLKKTANNIFIVYYKTFKNYEHSKGPSCIILHPAIRQVMVAQCLKQMNFELKLRF